MTANSSRHVKGRTPLELITGDTPVVSEHPDLGFCDFVQCRSNAGLDTPKLRRWLGVSHRVGKLVSHWILPQAGIPASMTAVQRVTNLEKQTDEMKNCMEDFHHSIQSEWHTRTFTIELQQSDHTDQNVPSLENKDEEPRNEFKRVIGSEDLPDSANDAMEMEKIGPDNWSSVEVGIDMGEHGFCHSRVEWRAIDAKDEPTGVVDNNILPDGCAHEVEFSDSQTEILTANTITENLLAGVNEGGNRFLLVEGIEDHRKTANATPEEQGTLDAPQGIERKRRTTRGWEFFVKWKGGSSDWVTLKEL